MDKIGIPDKINFHKQESEILYFDLLKSYLNKNKLEAKVVKMEEQIKRENVSSIRGILRSKINLLREIIK